MSTTTTYAGGCLCGAVRYRATGEPRAQGVCCCKDCRKASGSGFIAFMSFPAAQLEVGGETRRSTVKSLRGGDAVRNHCAICGSLVFGGIVGQDSEHTVYAGSLDEPDRFHPTIAVFVRDKPDWVQLPPGLKLFATLPGL